MGDVEWEGAGMTHIGALRPPVLFVLVQTEHGGIAISLHLQTGWISTKMCLQRGISGSRAKRKLQN